MELSDAAGHALAEARRLGVTDAEVVAIEGDELEVGVRLGKPEKLKRARERRLALRIFIGASSAVVSTADLEAAALGRLASEGQAMARATAADPFAGLPDDPPAADVADLDLFDPAVETISAEEALELARVAEGAALEADPLITNSEGAEFSAGSRRLVYLTSRGVRGEYRSSAFSLSVVPVATAHGQMQRDYWYGAARHRAGLEPPEAIGRRAAARTLRRLGGRSIRTCEVPVVFEPEPASSLLGHIVAALSGSSVYRGTSFLAGRIGEAIAARGVALVDDALRPRGLGSRPFDAEGLSSRRTSVLEDGILQSYLLDTYSARKLGLASTASAVRALGETPMAGASNFYLLPGEHAPEEIVRSVRRGLLVTELIGPGVNPVTGDYSRGAAGMWIENGEITHAVEEVTIAGNLLEMFAGIELRGSDLTFRSTLAAPTVRIGRMTVAGSA